MDKSVRSYKYMLAVCAFVILVLLVWLYVISMTGPSPTFTGERIEGAIASTTFTLDGGVVLFDGAGNQLKPQVELLPCPVKGDLNFITSLSMFGIKGSPIEVWIQLPDTTYCYLIDDITGKCLGSCR